MLICYKKFFFLIKNEKIFFKNIKTKYFKIHNMKFKFINGDLELSLDEYISYYNDHEYDENNIIISRFKECLDNNKDTIHLKDLGIDKEEFILFIKYLKQLYFDDKPLFVYDIPKNKKEIINLLNIAKFINDNNILYRYIDVNLTFKHIKIKKSYKDETYEELKDNEFTEYVYYCIYNLRSDILEIISLVLTFDIIFFKYTDNNLKKKEYIFKEFKFKDNLIYDILDVKELEILKDKLKSNMISKANSYIKREDYIYIINGKYYNDINCVRKLFRIYDKCYDLTNKEDKKEILDIFESKINEMIY